MRKWIRPISGGSIIALLLFFYGLPGHIEDAITWREWMRVIKPDDAVTVWQYMALGGTIPALLIATSEWWYTWLFGRRRRQSEPLATDSTSNHCDADLAHFRACLPHIERCRTLIRPFAGTLGTFNIALQVFHSGGDTLAQIATELEFLTKELTRLDIPCPDIWGENTFDKIRFRLWTWNTHLATLEARIHHGDLEGARSLEITTKDHATSVPSSQSDVSSSAN